MKHTLIILSTLSASLAMGQMIPNQSIKVEYDSRGNRVVRKLWNPQTPGNKRGDEAVIAEEHGLVAYPNPAEDWLALRSAAPDSASRQVVVINGMGQVVQEQFWAEGQPELRIELHGLATGLYQVAVWPAGHPEERKTISVVLR